MSNLKYVYGTLEMANKLVEFMSTLRLSLFFLKKNLKKTYECSIKLCFDNKKKYLWMFND